MKAALWYGRNDIRIEEVPDPGPPGPNEVILRVAYCGICGTDLEEYRSGPFFIPVDQPHPLTGRVAPLILGHEFVGDVVEVGRGVTSLKTGDRVAPDCLITCGECYWCQRHEVTLCDKLASLGLSTDGGLAAFCRVPVPMCIRVPEHIPYEHAALAEPLSVAVRAIRKGGVGLDTRVAIFGGGTIGLLCLQAARRAGASAVYLVEPHAGRRAIAEDLGATATLDPLTTDIPWRLRELTAIGPDVVVNATGSPNVVSTCIDAARKGGRIVLVGIPIAESQLHFLSVVGTEKQIIGSLSHVYDEDFAAAIRLLGQGSVNVDSLISDRIKLDDLLPRGLHRLEVQAADTLKILVDPS